MARLRFSLWIGALAFMIAGYGCGSNKLSSSAIGEQGESSAKPTPVEHSDGQLPLPGLLITSPQQLRATSEDNGGPWRLGSDWDRGLPNRLVYSSGSNACFYPWWAYPDTNPDKPNRMGYVSYSLNMQDYAEGESLYIVWANYPEYFWSSPWVGLSDFNADTWHWFEVAPGAALRTDFSPFISSGQRMYVLIAIPICHPIAYQELKLAHVAVAEGEPACIKNVTGPYGVYGYSGDYRVLNYDYTGAQPASFHWEFGGGAIPNNSAEPIPNIQFGSPGKYIMTVVVDNGFGLPYKFIDGLEVVEPVDGWVHSWHLPEVDVGGGGDLTHSTANSLAVSKDQSLFLAGTVYVENRDMDLLLMRYSASGQLLSSWAYGTQSREYGLDIVPTKDGSFYLMGTSHKPVQGDSYYLWILKVHPSGYVFWARQIGVDFSFRGGQLALASDGGVVIAATRRLLISGYTHQEPVVIKLDSQGQLVWARQWASQDGSASCVAVDEEGSIVVGGYFVNRLDSYLADLMLLRLSDTGSLVQALAYEGDDLQPGGLALDAVRRVYISATSYAGPQSAVAIGLEPDGTVRWAHRWLGTGASFGNAASLADDGSVFVGGRQYESGALILKFSTAGELLDKWAWFAQCNFEQLRRLLVAEDGYIYAAGETEGATGVWREPLGIQDTVALSSYTPPGTWDNLSLRLEAINPEILGAESIQGVEDENIEFDNKIPGQQVLVCRLGT